MNTAQPIELHSGSYQRFARNLSPRMALIWQVALDTGLRVSDVLGLRQSQLSRQITVEERKTKKERTVTVSADTLDRLREYARRYPDSPYVFASPSDHGKPMARSSVAKAITIAAKRAGITGTLTMHSARKTYAVELWRRTGDYKAVQADLHHKDLGTTLRYIHAVPPIT